MSSLEATSPSSSPPMVPDSQIKEEVPSTTSPPSDESPPSPPDSTSPPPPDSTPPPSPPDPPSPTAANPPPSQPPPSPTPSPPTPPPPAPPTSSSPPPPASTPPPSTPPPSTPAESPPPPASTVSPPPPAQSPPSATPSTPPPAEKAAPAQNPQPQAAAGDSPPLAVAYPPPQPKDTPAETPPAPLSLSPSPPRSSSAARPTASSPPTDNPSSSSQDAPNINPGVIVGIVFGCVVIILLLAVIICLMCSRRKRKPNYYSNGGNQYYNQDPAQWQHDPNAKLHPPAGSFMGAAVGGYGSGEFSSGQYSGQHPPVVGMVPPSQNMGGMTQFSYEDLAAATNGFSQSNLLGQGGFGLVHKGILPDRREVAVKSLKSGSGQGEREFQAEVEIISRVHHRHLVSLVGYCIANEKKILVYEFVPNKTLEFHLYGKDQPVIDWPTRLRIGIGSAKGLAYLHEDCLPRIIHRDIKAANILIDNNYEAMVADFGLAKLTTDNNTHVSTRVMGTFGYLAPEYASSGKLSEKSDVFSFGVMLLELITGRRPIDMSNMMEDSLVDWARPLLTKALEDGNFDELVDPRLEGKYAHLELSHMAACAAASIRHSARKRPKMSQIVRALEGDSSLDDLNEGVKPGQSAVYNPNGGTQVYDTRAYNADMLKFKKMVMASGEFNSSEYGTTSEYGLNPSVSSDSTADSREMDKTSIDINKNC